jgi:hypothetical protein
MELDHFALNFPLPPYDSSSYKLCHWIVQGFNWLFSNQFLN